MAIRILTLILACTCAMSVPVSQLRTFSTKMTCCCPDPDHCHCPDHKTQGKQSQLRSCHRGSDVTASADAPAIIAPQLIAIIPTVQIWTIEIAYELPHPASPLAYRDLPS